MRKIIKSIPWSGVGFILTSVILVGFWVLHSDIPFIFAIVAEIGTFFFFFFLVDEEVKRK